MRATKVKKAKRAKENKPGSKSDKCIFAMQNGYDKTRRETALFLYVTERSSLCLDF